MINKIFYNKQKMRRVTVMLPFTPFIYLPNSNNKKSTNIILLISYGLRKQLLQM